VSRCPRRLTPQTQNLFFVFVLFCILCLRSNHSLAVYTFPSHCLECSRSHISVCASTDKVLALCGLALTKYQRSMDTGCYRIRPLHIWDLSIQPYILAFIVPFFPPGLSLCLVWVDSRAPRMMACHDVTLCCLLRHPTTPL